MTTSYQDRQKYRALLRAVADYWLGSGQDPQFDRYMTGYAGRDWKAAIAEQRDIRKARGAADY